MKRTKQSGIMSKLLPFLLGGVLAFSPPFGWVVRVASDTIISFFGDSNRVHRYQDEARLLELINAKRASVGAEPLGKQTHNSRGLALYAGSRFDGDIWSHVSATDEAVFLTVQGIGDVTYWADGWPDELMSDLLSPLYSRIAMGLYGSHLAIVLQ